jgi:DNA-binding CsgD family transcriptional regulator
MEVRNLFLNLGKLIESAGKAGFPITMHDLVAKSVPLDFLTIAQWSTDESGRQVAAVDDLGHAGPASDTLAGDGKEGYFGRYQADHPTVQKILQAVDAQLILARIPDARSSGHPDRRSLSCSLSQCNLVSRRNTRRFIISFYRFCLPKDFTLQEMAFLKDFSDILLPVVEWHATTRHRIEPHNRNYLAPDKAEQSAMENLRQTFEDRLERAGLILSPRETAVCLALLSGKTVPEIASGLALQASTVETYIKRAAIKLDVRGRHGLTKWMIEQPMLEMA